MPNKRKHRLENKATPHADGSRRPRRNRGDARSQYYAHYRAMRYARHFWILGTPQER